MVLVGGFDRVVDRRLGSLPAAERPYKIDDSNIITDSYKKIGRRKRRNLNSRDSKPPTVSFR